MAVIVFSKAVPFPTAALRQLLVKYFPRYKWQCGEDDSGGADQIGSFARAHLIVGRAAAEPLFIEVKPHEAPFGEAGPPHLWHLEIGRPTTDNGALALQIQLVIAASLMTQDEERAYCRLRTGGNWLSSDEVWRALGMMEEGYPAAAIDALGSPTGRPGGAAGMTAPASLASRLGSLPMADRSPQARSAVLGVDTLGLADLQRTFATILGQQGGADFARDMGYPAPPPFVDEGVREDRLPTMVLLLNDLKLIDWERFEEGFNIIDRGGDWKLDGRLDGSATLTGRGGRITLELVSEPLPGYLIEQAFARSFWFPDGQPRARVRAHGSQLVMRCDLDTRAAPYEDVRQTAKVATLLLGIVAKQADVAGLYNAGIETIMDDEMVVKLTGILHDDEVPIQMWTWTAPHSLETDAVSLTSGGLAPFLGYEVEVWNAPGDLDFVTGKLNGALRYLLIEGPVVRHGDTMGEERGDRSIRCFFGDSKADRAKPVKAMFLEFRGPSASEPRPDISPAPVPPEETGPDAALRMLSGFIDENRRNAGKPVPPLPADGSIPPSGNPEVDDLVAKLVPDSPPDMQAALRNIASGFGQGPLVPPSGPASAARPITPAAPPPFPARRPGGFGRKGL